MPKGKYDAKVSRMIDAFWKKEYRSPVIREVMEICGIPSQSVAWYVLRKVAKQRGDYVRPVKYARTTVTPAWVVTAIKNAPKPVRRKPIAQERPRKLSDDAKSTQR